LVGQTTAAQKGRISDLQSLLKIWSSNRGRLLEISNLQKLLGHSEDYFFSNGLKVCSGVDLCQKVFTLTVFFLYSGLKLGSVEKNFL